MEENENQEDEELDIELTLQHLLAYSSDPDLKKRVVEKISKNTKLPPEKIEESSGIAQDFNEYVSFKLNLLRG